MLNLIPKLSPTINILFGKRPVQRIRVGEMNDCIDIPIQLITNLYKHIDATREYVNGQYSPLEWKTFSTLKLKAYYLYESYKYADKSYSILHQKSLLPRFYAYIKTKLLMWKMLTFSAYAPSNYVTSFPILTKDSKIQWTKQLLQASFKDTKAL